MESKHNKLAQVRAAFVLKGTSFNAWCRENKIVRRTAEQAVSGENKSANATKLADHITKSAGLQRLKAS